MGNGGIYPAGNHCGATGNRNAISLPQARFNLASTSWESSWVPWDSLFSGAPL